MVNTEYEALKTKAAELERQLKEAITPEERAPVFSELCDISEKIETIEVSQMSQEQYDTWIITH
jgi:hypothetical protein